MAPPQNGVRSIEQRVSALEEAHDQDRADLLVLANEVRTATTGMSNATQALTDAIERSEAARRAEATRSSGVDQEHAARLAMLERATANTRDAATTAARTIAPLQEAAQQAAEALPTLQHASGLVAASTSALVELSKTLPQTSPLRKWGPTAVALFVLVLEAIRTFRGGL